MKKKKKMINHILTSNSPHTLTPFSFSFANKALLLHNVDYTNQSVEHVDEFKFSSFHFHFACSLSYPFTKSVLIIAIKLKGISSIYIFRHIRFRFL